MQEETISLQDIFRVLKKRILLIIGLTITAMLIAGIISFYFLTPIYQGSTQILVNQKMPEQQMIQTQDIQTNLQLINTYNVIIKSPVILEKVIDNLDLETTPAQLTNMITVTNASDSQVVNITVENEEANLAVDIVNTVALVFKDEIKELMNVEDNVTILSQAVLSENPTPVKPNKTLNIAIAMVIGLMISVGLAFLLEYLDTTVKTEQDVEDLLDLPILGLVSPIPDNHDSSDSPQRNRSKKIEKVQEGGTGVNV